MPVSAMRKRASPKVTLTKLRSSESGWGSMAASYCSFQLRELPREFPVLAIDRACMPRLRVEHPFRRALVAGLVRIVAGKPIFSVCTGPAPRVHGAAKRQQELIETFHDDECADLARTRSSAKDLPTDL